MATKTGLSKYVTHKNCKYCQKQFAVKDRPTSAYCSENCRKLALQGKTNTASYNRPYTPDTAFLINKWYSEGTSIATICDILHRSRENVMKCLKVAEAHG